MRWVAPESAEAQAWASRPGPESLAWRYVRDAAPAVSNARTRMLLLDTGHQAFPVSVNDGDDGRGNCYVVSPLCAYADYADDELRRLGRPWVTWPLRGLARSLGAALAAARIDRIVQVNNWLLSTNLYPPHWDGRDLPALTEGLIERWPDHAIAWRSLNPFSNSALAGALARAGYQAVPSRQVWLFDVRAGAGSACLRHHNTRLDAVLLRRARYRVEGPEGLVEADYPRLQALYEQLYLQKYSRLNPEFGVAWIRAGVRDGWLDLRVLRSPEGRIDGVVGWFGRTDLFTAPLVGYDTALPARWGLYRMLTRLCLQEAVARRAVLNFSAGAGRFKRLRGGHPVIECNWVHTAHLPRARRTAWSALSAVLRHVAVPLIERWEP